MSLRKATIRLAYERPELRAHLLPLLARTASPDEEAMDMLAGRTWGEGELIGGGTGNPSASADDKNPPYNKRNLGKGGCNKEDDDGKCYAQRIKYNKRYREEVCFKDKHKGPGYQCDASRPKPRK
jgi:hypothetical protein